jgi:hypothetical protein
VFNVITKSGTNQFHGSVYEYIENDALNAQNKFAQPPPFNKPAVRWNEYGFNLGGPHQGHANHRSDNFFSVAYWYQTEPHVPFPVLPSLPRRIPKLFAVGGPGINAN